MFKVLLVDDEVFVRKGLQKLIRWEQFKCTLVGEAKNGGEALDMINRLEPDLVITDIMMPVLDGLDLIRSVKEAGRIDPEFIIISGYNDFNYAQQAIRYGVQDYILKPIDVKELGASLQKLAAAIDRKRLAALAGGGYSAAAILEAFHIFEMDPSMYNQFMVELEENNKEAFGQMIDTMFQIFHDQRVTLPAVVGSLSRFITRVMRIIKQMDGNDEGQRRLLETMEREYRTWNLRRLKEHFTRMVTEAAEHIAQLRKEQSKGDIARIKKYIDTHYRESINLKSIAAQFYMNSVYLGQLFRKHYGVYFNDYLLELRVEEAKKLLRQTDLRMYEIAARVGIQNANYFVTQFEKLEKLSPMEYRNKLVKKE